MRAEEPVAVARLEWETGSLGSVASKKLTFAQKPPEGVTPPKGLAGAQFGNASLGAERRIAFAIAPG